MERDDIFQNNEEEGCDNDDDGDFDASGETGQIEGCWEEDDEEDLGMNSTGREHEDHSPPATDGPIQSNQNIQSFNNFHDQNHSYCRNQIRGVSANTSSVAPFNNYSGEDSGHENVPFGQQSSQHLHRKSKQKGTWLFLRLKIVIFAVANCFLRTRLKEYCKSIPSFDYFLLHNLGSDDLDIQSLSTIEAENIYHLPEEGNTLKKKDSVKLDAFHIIKVIGKGDRNLTAFLFVSRLRCFYYCTWHLRYSV